MDDKDKLDIILLLVLFAVFRLPFSQAQPLVADENLYAQMTNEFIEHPGLAPTFLGESVSWRPIGYFAINAPFVLAGKALGASVELTYRLCGLFFSALTIIALYFLVKQMYKNSDLAFFSTAIYSVMFIVVFVNNEGLTDNVLMFFVFSSMYYYLKGKNNKDFLIGGLFAFAAYFVKTVMAFIVPFLVILYWLAKDKKVLTGKAFLLSMLATPLAACIVAAMFHFSGLLSSDIFTFLIKFESGKDSYVDVLLYSGMVLYVNILIFGGFWVYGLVKKAASFDPFLIIWSSVLPLLLWGSRGGMPWYLLPALPTISILVSIVLLDKNLRADKLAWAVLSVMIVITFFTNLYVYSIIEERKWERPAGQFLAGKEGVMYAGAYMPGAIFYKIQADGKAGSVCMTVTGSDWDNAQNDTLYYKEILDNQPGSYKFNREFTDVFWSQSNFMMKCPGFETKYLVVAKVPKATIDRLGDFSLIRLFGEKAEKGIAIYKKKSD